MRTGSVFGAAGSAYIESGNTKIICSVYGPRWNKKLHYSETGQLSCEVQFASTTAAQPQRRRRGQDTIARALSEQLVSALLSSVHLESFPKSVVELHVLVIEDDGAVLPTAITCASLALADANIELHDLIAAASVTHYCSTHSDNQEESILRVDADLTDLQHSTHVATLTTALMHSTETITLMEQRGRILTAQGQTHPQAEQVWETMLQLCIAGSSQVLQLMRVCLKESLVRKIKEQTLPAPQTKTVVTDAQTMETT